jgi:hypothetical protein
VSVVQRIAESRKAPNRTKNIKALLPRYPYPVEEEMPVTSSWVLEEVIPNVFELIPISKAQQLTGKRGRGRPPKALTYQEAVKRGLIRRIYEKVRKFIYG